MSFKRIFIFRECEHKDLSPEFALKNGMGGTENVFLSFIENLKNNFEIKVNCPCKSRKNFFENVEFIPFENYSFTCKEIENYNPDIIIVVANPKLIYSSNYKFKEKTIFWQHNHPEEMKSFNIKSLILEKNINIVFPTQEAADFSKRFYNFDKNIYGINNYIRKEFFIELERKKEKIKNNVAFLGCLCRAKGFLSFLKAVLELKEINFFVFGSFNLYGENTEDKKFKLECEEILSKINNLIMLGNLNLNEIIDNLKNIDIVIANPNYSNKETCCLSALEPMCLGIPVITGAKSIVEKNMLNGSILCDDKDLKEKILYLLNNNQKKEELSNNGKKFVRENFNSQKISNKWIEFLSKK